MIGPQPARRRAADRYVPIVLNKVAVVQTALTYLTSVGGHLIVSSLKILRPLQLLGVLVGVSGLSAYHPSLRYRSKLVNKNIKARQAHAALQSKLAASNNIKSKSGPSSSRRPVSLLQLFDQLFVCPGVPYSATFMLVYLLYLLIGLVSMYDTFRLGFHSPRQLLYGVLFALYLHTALFYFVHRRLNCFLPLTNSAWADSLEVLPVLYLDILSVTVGVYTQSTIARGFCPERVKGPRNFHSSNQLWFKFLLHFNQVLQVLLMFSDDSESGPWALIANCGPSCTIIICLGSGLNRGY
eukprot:g18285.t1